MSEDAKRIELPPAAAEQIRRANVLLDLAEATEDVDSQFILRVGALHLARAIPEYYFALMEDIPLDLNPTKPDTELRKNLRKEAEAIFDEGRRFRLLTALRECDYHREPLLDARGIGPNATIGRGKPARFTTGPNKNSSVTFLSGNRLITTGSGKRIGRSSYYQICQSRYKDPAHTESVPLALALREFLEDLPHCVAAILAMPEVNEYRKRHE